MSVPASALAAAYTRLTTVLPALDVIQPPADRAVPGHDGWITADALANGGTALDTFLARDEAQARRDYGRSPRPDVVASFGLRRYIWPACLLITVPWFLLRRVPRFPVTHVSYDRTAPGLPMGRLAARPVAFACLPDDPAALLPGARIVPDEEALRAEVRSAVAEHLEPVLDGFGPRTRRRGHALWALVTDEVVESLEYVSALFGEGEQERARHELGLLLPGTTRPYVGSATFGETVGPDGESLPTRVRVSCCMYYTLRPEDTCATCPRTCDAERLAALSAAAN